MMVRLAMVCPCPSNAPVNFVAELPTGTKPADDHMSGYLPPTADRLEPRSILLANV